MNAMSLVDNAAAKAKQTDMRQGVNFQLSAQCAKVEAFTAESKGTALLTQAVI